MAGIHSGVLQMSCEVCKSDPNIKEVWGCDEPAQSPVWVDEDDVFLTCPVGFVRACRAVKDLMEEIDYYRDFPGNMPRFDERPVRFLEAFSYYKEQLDRMNHEKPKHRNPSRDSLGILRESFLRRKNG